MEHKIYFVRHAPTEANISGSMVKDYDSYDIIRPIDDKSWHEKVGCYIRRSKNNADFRDALHNWVLSSPATRCISTARYLFPHPSKADHEWISPAKELLEIDCEGLDSLKFWEVTKEEFDAKVHPDIGAFEKRVDDFLNAIAYDCEMFNMDYLCFGHGLYIRYLYNKLTRNGDSCLYDLINSRTFKFNNLDMLECTVKDGKISVTNIYRFKE